VIDPLKSCDCPTESAYPDYRMKVRTIRNVCSDGITEAFSFVDYEGESVPTLLEVVARILTYWAEDMEDGPHTFGYILNDGASDEVQLWWYLGADPCIGWDACQVYTHRNGAKLLSPHQITTVVDWTYRIVGEDLDMLN
jgi:hypothetical protein